MESIIFQSGITSASLQVVFERFSNFASKKIDLFLEVDDELKKLERTLLKIQALVDDVENTKSIIPKACQLLLEDLRNVLFDADDLLDEIGLKLEKLNPGVLTLTNRNQVRDMVLSTFEFNIPREVSKMHQKLDCLVRELEVYFMAKMVKLRQPQILAIPPSSSLVDELSVIGRDRDKDEMIRMLLSVQEEGGERISVIPIVGMGGIGKTTLAQLVYNHANVVEEFELRMWVCVSLDFDVVKITKSIYESVAKKVLELSNLDSIQIELQEKMRGKKFLLVLDDMWNENPSNWDVLRLPFRFADQGSVIVVTTRSEIVSSIVATTPAYRLYSLSNRDCWTIIKQRALSSMNLDGHEDLEEVGLKIAEKCKGLPLAAKMVGSVLRFKSREMEWDTLLKCDLWGFSEDKNQIYPVLKQSYDHLPTSLKRCFTYCSIFPHNYEFEKDDLIQLWSAEGFIQAQGMRSIEDIGREYFGDLSLRSFFHFSHVNVLDQRIYKMHNLIHDLARLVSADLCFSMEGDMTCILPIPRNARHSSLICQDTQPSTLEVFQRYEKLRTFMLFSKDGSHTGIAPYDFFVKLRCLRVLNLSCSDIFELPNSIENLVHLRYLDLSDTHIEELPESTTNLLGLETLKLKNCKLRRLPENLKNLIKLRHLDFDMKGITSMPIEVGKLSSLQTLHAFIVGKSKGHRIEELQKMRCLSGSICITNLENVANFREAKTAMLDNKQYLDKLELQWNEISDARIEQEVLAGLEPHGRLKELRVTNYGGFMFPSWIGNPSCHKLVNIRLQNCRLCKLLPSLGQLPALKSLYIQAMPDLEGVDHQFCRLAMTNGFPSLESLTFHDMPKLRIWTGINENDMPCLKHLTMVDCPNLVTLPSIHYLASLENLEISRCHELQSLPEEGLPISLQVLIILESNILKERCKVREGEDWNKIRWVPKIEIDYEEIPLQGRDN